MRRTKKKTFRVQNYFLYISPRGKRYNCIMGGNLYLYNPIKKLEKLIEEENIFQFETMVYRSKYFSKERTTWHIYDKDFKHNGIVEKFRASEDIPKSAHILIFIDMFENITCVWLKQKHGVRKLNGRQWESLIKKIKKGKGKNLIYIKGNDKKSVIKKGILEAKEFERETNEKTRHDR